MAHLIKKVSEKFQKLQKDFRTPKAEADSFSKLNKSQVLQECKQFNNPQLNDKQCRLLLSQLIYLINQGNTFSDAESSTLFFQITKLFQSNNKELRRMIYLMIKEFRDENTMYIITQSLMKDIISTNDLFRMNAFRTIPLVLDPSNLIQVERYIKNAIIDKNYAVSSAALLAAIQLFSVNSESIKKLTTDVSAAMSNHKTSATVNFHAQILLHEIKKSDKNSYIKILQEQAKEASGAHSSTLSTMQLIRFMKETLLTQELDPTNERAFIEFLTRQTNKSNEMIIIESCKALCELKNISNKDLVQPITVLSIFLIGNNTVNKFAALRIINRLVSNPVRKPIITNKADIQSLLSDNNKSISSLAVSILLKLCNEEDVESLLGQIYENLQDMSDEFKVDILNSIRGLVRQLPKKFKQIMGFLFNCMKKEGNVEFKSQCIDIIEDIIRLFPTDDVREQGLQVLSEYIEDCLIKTLQLKVLSIINRECSKNSITLKMIRLINNRIHLEDSEVRAAAVGTISKFAQKQPAVKQQVIDLLRQAMNDPDEEVRERAFQNISVLSQKDNSYAEEVTRSVSAPIDFDELAFIEKYIELNKAEIEESEEVDILSRETIQEFAKANKIEVAHANPASAQAGIPDYEDDIGMISSAQNEQVQAQLQAAAKKESEQFLKYAKLFSESPIFSKYGKLQHLVAGGNLTEKDADYQVSYCKYFFNEHIVLEFLVKNTVSDTILRDVKVKLELNNDEVDVALTVAAAEIKEGETSNVFVGVARNPENKIVAFASPCYLNFQVVELGRNGQVASEYADDSQVEDIAVTVSDHLTAWELTKGKFETEFSYLQGDVLTQKFKLSYKSVDFAIQEIVKHFNISTCDQSNVLAQNQTEKFHTLKLAGKYLDSEKIAMDARQGCVLQMNVKSGEQDLNDDLVNTFNN